MRKIKGFVEFEGKTYWVDMNDEHWIVEIVEKDGSRREAKVRDVNLMDLLFYGKVLGDNLPEK